MSYNTFGAPGWEITPVGKTALEQALARHLSRAVAVENIVFGEPDPLSTAGNGFAPRRGTVTTRAGRGEENRVDLFFKIPAEREVEALVLGHRLGMKHLPRILVSSLDIASNGVESRALCYVFVPGKPLGNDADGNPFTANSLPEGIVDDMAILHASTAGHAEAYLRRGYTFVSREGLIEEATVGDPAAYLGLPGIGKNAGDLINRAAAVSAGAVDLAAGDGPVVVHGDLEPSNVVVGDDGSGTLVDWGEMGLGWAALDLAPCLGYDQLPLYKKTAGDRNPSWNPPDEKALAAARLVHALVRLKRLAGNPDGPMPSAGTVEALFARLDEALGRL
ncbi:MAG: hypothetical protein A2Y64_04475 [Candidatus Coatesbacteria bacterium RBG_13_66_14]|uniref:Aminoglycoside phosphotransferase domain-containing protein n=1 Tax=Candidatus Coatesbacteria bacterium RBG_13_66_14 TaxID=1817816 RepID=A0A1F5FB52_9BACT|nr:MAG: hypothetical protein A2Y64_04475 [Candidatus Coatesbacteria bacterium RBG_13_66_14]